MGNIASILLIPAPEHREALLGDGLCGARVPWSGLVNGRWLPEGGHGYVDSTATAWASSAAPGSAFDGMAPCGRASPSRLRGEPLLGRGVRPDAVRQRDPDAPVQERVCRNGGCGCRPTERVLLDADGREVPRG